MDSVSNFYGVENYREKLDAYALEDPAITKEAQESRSEKILKRVFGNEAIKIDQRDDEFYQELNAAIRNISMIKPGRKLLKRLDKCKKIPLNICSNASRNESTFSIEYVPDNNTVYITPKVYPYYIGHDGSIHKHLFEVLLAHELIHALHFAEDYKSTCIRKLTSLSKVLIDPEFDDLEEQVAISGISSKENNGVELCENAFLQALGMDWRVGHGGLGLEEELDLDQLGLDHLIVANAISNVTLFLQKTPDALKQIHSLDWMDEAIKKDIAFDNLYPLSLAILRNGRKVEQTLVDQGAPLNVTGDDCGGPILAFCIARRGDTALDHIKSIREKKLPIDSKFLLESLIKGYGEKRFNGGPVFYELLWEVDQLQISQLPIGSFSPLFHQALLTLDHFKAINIYQWIISNRPESISGLDAEGNSAIMAFLQHLIKFPTITSRPDSHFLYSAQWGVLNQLLKLPNIELHHQNHAGETISSLAGQTKNRHIIKLVDECMNGLK